jgi:glycerol uptake facilitator protein
VALLEKQADWIVITTGWGLAVALGVYVSGKASGGHLTPRRRMK